MLLICARHLGSFHRAAGPPLQADGSPPLLLLGFPMHPHAAVATPSGDPHGCAAAELPREEVFGHLQRYAARTGLLPCVRLHTRLVRARYTRMNSEWRLGLRDEVTGRSWQCSADVLVLCRSSVAAPRPPPPLPVRVQPTARAQYWVGRLLGQGV